MQFSLRISFGLCKVSQTCLSFFVHGSEQDERAAPKCSTALLPVTLLSITMKPIGGHRSQRVLPDRPGEGSQPKSGTADTSDSFQKSTSEESDAITTTPVNYGIKERCHETEESLQPVIHGETSTDHDADEGPRIAKILYLPRSPNLKDDNFQHANHEEAPGHRDAD